MLQLVISIANQQLSLVDGEQTLAIYSISTALNGVGELKNSGCTPRGKHYIRAKIGSGLPVNAVFVGRRFTGEIYSSDLAAKFPQRDWILTRILWLSGCEHGFNRLGDKDSMQRYIYIHGTPDSEPMGIARSHGCIRMRNSDMLELFERVSYGAPVFIQE
ncbi:MULTISPECIES: L,D-transpeptidase [unclassified Neptuniibacter]|jgi:lipoprotein-anchoring transpeptidase ErfK/SrfK|uniref:L,D-transpeptidase n=1 Tax=unclassified Neptuniibacter TaxID=2630693 RepID=UPI0026E12CEB|nr:MULTISPECIES: L,D-transpeptidase [unclassified Neptuniibacter]MDO6514678.1 L,D-transpeptidase [Neptuniibacter sp. 2_MG-2023]MDO6594930.1 L,D-transpeptidase [Neptuniibacter sp. 1_MG-2023]